MEEAKVYDRVLIIALPGQTVALKPIPIPPLALSYRLCQP